MRHRLLQLLRSIFVILSILLLESVVYVFAQARSSSFVYVVNEASDNISEYNLNEITGALSPVPGSPIATPHRPHWLAVNPSGTFAYLVTDDGVVAKLVAFSINRNTGALTASSMLSLTAPAASVPIVDPAGQYLVLASGKTGAVSAYSLSSTTGAPTLIATANTGVLPWSVSIDPLSKFVFVAGASNAVAGLALSGAQPTVIAGSPWNVRSIPKIPSKRPIAQIAVIHPAGSFLYVTDPTTSTISVFSVSTNGALSPIGGSPFGAQGTVASDMKIDPSGQHLYVGDWFRGIIAGFSISPSGALTPIVGSPFVTPFTSASKLGGATAVTIDASGHYLYATSTEANQIAGFAIDSNTGALTPAGALLPTGTFPFRVVVSP
jgi:6-phosphogluconolactonase (cycloisomerase 2 family)